MYSKVLLAGAGLRYDAWTRGFIHADDVEVFSLTPTLFMPVKLHHGLTGLLHHRTLSGVSALALPPRPRSQAW